MFSVRFSSIGTVSVTVPPSSASSMRSRFPLGALSDARQLAAPVALEVLRPFVNGTQRLGVRAVEDLSRLAAHVDQAHVPEHLEVLRHRRLTEAELPDDVADGTLAVGEKNEDVAAAGLGN